MAPSRTVHAVRMSRAVEAPPDRVWDAVSDPNRLATWFAFAERVEVLQGEGLGRRQRLHGRWGRKPAEVDQRVVEWDEPRRLAWVHEEERVGGTPAPRFAAETRFEISLDAAGTGTRVTLESRQVPASRLKGLLMRMFGTREVAKLMQRSLAELAAQVAID